jgi:ATP-dependent HslUV protease ATP-binding subunit HslU
MKATESLTPSKIVDLLDRYIVGQKDAKRAIAIALRNRYRRSLLADELREEVVPKNILMIGPTGVGKTEIARRIAKIVNAPFVKVEATKFTEIGYVGRDVESMVRDLLETSIRMVKLDKTEQVKDRAGELAEERLVEILVPSASTPKNFKNPLEMLFNPTEGASSNPTGTEDADLVQKRRQVAHKLAMGELEEHVVEVEVEDAAPAMFDLFGGAGMEQMGLNMNEMFGNIFPKKLKKRKVTVKEARKILTQEEAAKLIDIDEVHQEAIRRAEQSGMIFIDEIDKIAGKETGSANISREGVQRDILPILEGSAVNTKYGIIKTDHILFVAAGAFHIAKPSDLIPELQGRLPIRVELNSLNVDDFVRILTEPKNALLKQYSALLETEGIKIEFSDEAIMTIAQMAKEVNDSTENIGARRLHTILEKLLEELSFNASDITMEKVVITPQYVEERLKGIVKNRDLSQYIL